MPKISFVSFESWSACVKAGFIYKIDYPVFDPKDPHHLQYGVMRYRLLDLTGIDLKTDPPPALPAPELIDLGRFDTREAAEKACEEHADADGQSAS